jgi:hypothetical protein
LTELFFEDSEPPLVQVSLGRSFELFPQGNHRFHGKTVRNQLMQARTR